MLPGKYCQKEEYLGTCFLLCVFIFLFPACLMFSLYQRPSFGLHCTFGGEHESCTGLSAEARGA